MPLDIIYIGLLSVIDLLKITLIISIPVFLLVIAGIFLRKKIINRFKMSWIKASFIATYIMFLVLLFFVYFLPGALVFFGTDPNILPEEMRLTLMENTLVVLGMVFKMLLNALIFTVILTPLELIASGVAGKLEAKYKRHWLINTFAGVFAAVLAATTLVVFLFPWAPAGVYYLIYWG